MDTAERKELEGELLTEVGTILHDVFAANEWGRALARVRLHGGIAVLESLDIDEIVGDEARVDEACTSDAAQEAAPVVARVAEALCSLADVDLENVDGATFIRLPNGKFAWLPGLVGAPSQAFDSERAALEEWTTASERKLDATFCLSKADRFEADTLTGTLLFIKEDAPFARAEAILLGSFAKASRTWAWGWSNPSVDPAARARSASLTDAILDRSIWEISTPHFFTDEPTARALAAFVARHANAIGLYRASHEDGAIYFALRSVEPWAPN